MLLILWLLHIFIILYEWSKHSMSIMLWAMLLVVFTLPHTAYSYGYEYSPRLLSDVTLFVIIFMLLYILCRLLYFSLRPGKVVTITFDGINQTPKGLLDCFYYTYVAAFAVVMLFFYGHGRSILTAKWTEGWSQSPPEHIANILLTALAGLGFVFFARKEYLRFAVMLGIYIINLIISQSRYNVIGFIAPFMIYFLFSDNRKNKIRGVLVGVGVIFGVFLLQQYRWLGGLDNALNAGFEQILTNSLNYMKGGNGEFGLIKAFYYFMDNDNKLRDFGEGNGYIRLSMFFLPASIFAFKPRDFAIDMYREWYHYDYAGGTMHPTLFGDVYANFGYAGVVMGAIYALILSIFDEVVASTRDSSMRVLKISLICTYMVLLGRGAVYNSTFNCIIGIAVVSLLEFAYKRYLRNRNMEGEYERNI